jgi:LytR cell envelope-related transcriptional attenuator
VLIVGGVIVGVAVLVAVLLSLGGGSKHARTGTSGSATTSSSGVGGQAKKKHTRTSSGGSSSQADAGAANPAETSVVVLNGTGTAGLAHRVSGELRQGGFARASALNGRPPGANQVTVVEYASGHQADAQSVAQALGVSQAQPMEGTVSSLAGSATVVVIVGLDKAATAP